MAARWSYGAVYASVNLASGMLGHGTFSSPTPGPWRSKSVWAVKIQKDF